MLLYIKFYFDEKWICSKIFAELDTNSHELTLYIVIQEKQEMTYISILTS
jgi:hypothetical protein